MDRPLRGSNKYDTRKLSTRQTVGLYDPVVKLTSVYSSIENNSMCKLSCLREYSRLCDYYIQLVSKDKHKKYLKWFYTMNFDFEFSVCIYLKAYSREKQTELRRENTETSVYPILSIFLYNNKKQ